MPEELQTQAGVTATPPVAEAPKEQSTPAENPPAEESGQKEEENKIPLSRVREMLARAKEDAKKEFTQPATEKKESAETTEKFKQGQDYVRMLIQSELEPFKAQMELDKTMNRYPDLPKFKEEMVGMIKQNPNLSYEEAYKLAKFDSLQQTSFESGKKEAIQNIQTKKGSAVETQKMKSAPKLDLENINIMDKSISLADIEKMLPHG